MTITYRQSKFDAPYKVPVLHKVVYALTENKIPDISTWIRRESEISEWLEENCQHRYYHSPGYFTEKFIEFECDEDAMLFALRFGI